MCHLVAFSILRLIGGAAPLFSASERLSFVLEQLPIPDTKEALWHEAGHIHSELAHVPAYQINGAASANELNPDVRGGPRTPPTLSVSRS